MVSLRAAALCAASMVLFWCAPALAEKKRIRIALQLPITNHLGVNLSRFKEKVEASTNGAFEFEIIDRARAFKDNEVWQAVSRGDIEMGTVSATQFVDLVPAVDVYQQPFLFNFDALTRAATAPGHPIRALIEKAILNATGVRPLWWQYYGSAVLFSNKRATLLPRDIRDQSVRTYGKTAADFIRHCGGKPKVIRASEQNQAMKTGVVDIVMTGVAGVKSRSLWEVSDTITRTQHGAIEFIVVINERLWQSFSKEHRELMTKAAAEVDKELWDKISEIEANAYKFAREKGLRIVELNMRQLAEWRACSAPMTEAFMSMTGQLGREMMAEYGKLLAHPCCNKPPGGSFIQY